MNHCLNCGKETSNPRYCSRSCAAQCTNRYSPKRKKREYHCLVCGARVSARRKYCDKCRPNSTNWDQVSLGDMQSKRKYQVNSRIRELARRVYLASGKPPCCAVCGYSKHFEVCHVRSINSFPVSATINQINSPDNLVALCPNCHWEFDNGLLSL